MRIPHGVHMRTQHYKLPATPEHFIHHAKPGQFVFHTNDSSEVSGFIDFVSDNEIAVMLFEPTDIDLPNATSISEQCDWLPRLEEIFEADHEIREMWADSMNRTLE